MKWNYVMAFVLSLAIFVGWDYFYVRPRKQAMPTPSVPAQAADPVATASSATREPLRPPVTRESLRVYEVGDNRLTVNRFGGSIHQWEIRENDRWLTLVPVKDNPGHSLTTFPDLPFETTLNGDTLVLSARRADGLSVEKSLRLNPRGHLHELRLRVTNPATTDLSADYDIGWGPGVEAGDEAGNKSGASKGTQRALVVENDNARKVKTGTLTGTFR